LTAYPNRYGEEAAMPETRIQGTAQRQLVALTTDSALIRALQDLTGDGTAVFVLSDVRALSDELMQRTGAVALIDAGSLDAPIDGVVDAFSTQFPDLKLLVAGHTPDQNALTRRIASQAVFRFVHKPVSPQRLKLFLDAAARPDTQRGQLAPAEPSFAEPSSLRRLDTAVQGRSPLMLATVGVAVIAAIAAAAWVFWLKDSKPAAVVAAAPAPAEQATANSPAALALIHKGDRAFADARYVALDGSSAAEFYREALKVQPGNAVARSGFDRSIEYGIRRAEEALVAGKLNEAAAAAEALRPLAADNSRLAFLNSQIEKEQSRVNADASQRAANEARQVQIRESLTAMSERMRRGQLVDPASGNAITYFRQAESIGPADPQVRNARDSLVAALLTAADAELTARKAPSAKRLVDSAATLNSSAPGLDVMRRRLDEFAEQQLAASTAAEAARTAEAARVAAAAAAPAPAAAAPVVAATAASADPANSVVPATTLKLVRSAVPEYPPRALEQLVSGWVEMEFTVTRDGAVKDVVVKSSEPARTFDSAAQAAMRRYRYEPVMRNGAAVEQRARLRIRFTAKEGR